MATLEFFYDFTSPYSYLASTQVEAVAARAGGALRWRPFLLGGVFKATGNRAPIETVAKGRHMWIDLERWARRLQVPIRRPRTFPVPTILALRAALAAPPERLPAATHALFRAVWVDDREVGDPTVLAAVLGEVGLPGTALVAAAPEQKAALTAQTQEAVDRGSFGAPTFFVGEQLFVGNDRLDFAEAALREAVAAGR
jgi:2-hydroxychromene-2-carboxylate isomerase